jgi:hypothetical protein
VSELNSSYYTAFFCEENIWHLVARLLASGIAAESLSVLLLSNRVRQIPLFAQRAGRESDGLVVWDYHVILHQASTDCGLIFDYDSRLPMPCPFKRYALATFPDTQHVQPLFHPLIRIIPATAWLRHFHSDRSHMLNAAGEPLQAFPAWSPITPHADVKFIDFQDYLDMQQELNDGSRVCELAELENTIKF